jgi:hypothetical protein
MAALDMIGDLVPAVAAEYIKTLAPPSADQILDVPSDAKFVILTIPKCTTLSPSIWPDKSTAVLWIMSFMDDLRPWNHYAHMGDTGGIVLDSNRKEIAEANTVWTLWAGTGRRIGIHPICFTPLAPPPMPFRVSFA